MSQGQSDRGRQNWISIYGRFSDFYARGWWWRLNFYSFCRNLTGDANKLVSKTTILLAFVTE